MPKSFLFFVATGVIFLLQAFPVTGIILMMMLAPFWSIALINAGFIGTGVEALTGSVARGWILLPLLWFTGYGAVAWNDHAVLAKLRDQVAAQNARVHVPFDAEHEVLVSNEGTANSQGVGVDWFVQNYALPVAYTFNATAPEAQFHATRLAGNELCRRLFDTPEGRASGVRPMWFHDSPGQRIADGVFEQRFCTIDVPQAPDQPQVLIARGAKETSVDGLPVTFLTTTIASTDGATHVLGGGIASPLSWLPMPVIGCGLDSGAARWKCTMQFWRNSFQPLESVGRRYGAGDVVLAEALGLRPVLPADRTAAPPDEIEALIADAARRKLDAELAKLDAVVADPEADIGSVPFDALLYRPDIVTPRLSSIMTTIETAIARKGNNGRGHSNGQQLLRLFDRVERGDRLPYADRLRALQSIDPWFVEATKLVD